MEDIQKNTSKNISETRLSYFDEIIHFIEKYRLYLIIPFCILLLQIQVSKNVFGQYVGLGSDIRAFYFGILNSWNNPLMTYDQGFYLNNDAWPYMYMPLFALLFYPMTIWGLETFATIFYLTGIGLFCISIFLWDWLLIRKQISWGNRSLLLIMMCYGTHYAWNFMFNQSKLYVVFLITLILVADQKNWSEWIIHFLFICLIAIMTHLIFWYLFYFLKQSFFGKNTEKIVKRNKKYYSGNDFRSFFSSIDWKTIFMRIIIAGIIFSVGNILFFINTELISSYLQQIFGEFVIDYYNYEVRAQNSIFGYILYLIFQNNSILWKNFAPIWSLVTAFALLGIILFALLKKQSLLTCIGELCIAIIAIDPLNEEHYYVFLLPTICLWIGHNIGKMKQIPKWFDVILHISLFAIINWHLLIPTPWRTILYFLLIMIILYFYKKLPSILFLGDKNIPIE